MGPLLQKSKSTQGQNQIKPKFQNEYMCFMSLTTLFSPCFKSEQCYIYVSLVCERVYLRIKLKLLDLSKKPIASQSI